MPSTAEPLPNHSHSTDERRRAGHAVHFLTRDGGGSMTIHAAEPQPDQPPRVLDVELPD